MLNKAVGTGIQISFNRGPIAELRDNLVSDSGLAPSTKDKKRLEKALDYLQNRITNVETLAAFVDGLDQAPTRGYNPLAYVQSVVDLVRKFECLDMKLGYDQSQNLLKAFIKGYSSVESGPRLLARPFSAKAWTAARYTQNFMSYVLKHFSRDDMQLYAEHLVEAKVKPDLFNKVFSALDELEFNLEDKKELLQDYLKGLSELSTAVPSDKKANNHRSVSEKAYTKDFLKALNAEYGLIPTEKLHQLYKDFCNKIEEQGDKNSFSGDDSRYWGTLYKKKLRAQDLKLMQEGLEICSKGSVVENKVKEFKVHAFLKFLVELHESDIPCNEDIQNTYFNSLDILRKKDLNRSDFDHAWEFILALDKNNNEGKDWSAAWLDNYLKEVQEN